MSQETSQTSPNSPGLGTPAKEVGNATFTFNENTVELPVIEGSEGELGVDISDLRSATKIVTLDYGFANTAACESAITFIDGDQGILRYRGIPIEKLAELEQPSFLETSYLLIWGELPTVAQLDEFRFDIRKHTLLHEDFRRFFEGFPKDAHPMGILSSAVSALSTFYQSSNDIYDPEQVHTQIVRLMAKLPTIAAYAYKKSIGQPFLYPDNSLDLIENFLRMMFAVPSEPFEANPVAVEALKLLLILHADHEQNCSSSTVRLVGSSEANLFASVAAGINALWGPRHGGANQAVLEMLEEIIADGGDVHRAVQRAKDPNDRFRLQGFGHRVYKNHDPRAKIIKQMADRVLKELGVNDPLIDVATELEAIALQDDYFLERRLYPNVDFYSGIIYRALGFPTQMFTVLFAIGRLPGWIAQWKEMVESPKTRIGRPRQIYTGATERNWLPPEQR